MTMILVESFFAEDVPAGGTPGIPPGATALLGKRTFGLHWVIGLSVYCGETPSAGWEGGAHGGGGPT